MPATGTKRWALRVRRFTGWFRLALIGTAPLVFGSAHVPVIAGGCIASLLVLALTVIPAHRRGGWTRRHAVPWPVFLVLPVAAWALLQCLPIPPAAGRILPDWLVIWGGADRLLGRGVGWHPLSLDPGATALQAARLVSLASLAYAQAVVVRREGLRAIKEVCWAIAGAGAVQMAAAGAQVLAPPGTLLWTAVPAGTGAGTGFRGTFANPGQQAESLMLAALCALALALEGRSAARRVVAILILVACGAGVLLTGRILVWVAFSVAAVGLAATVAVAARKRGLPVAPRGAAVLALALAAASGLGFLTLPRVLPLEPPDPDYRPSIEWNEQVQDVPGPSWSRRVLWTESLPLLAQHPVAGVGAGAFASVFPRVNESHPSLRFEHPESVPVEILLEGGLAGLLLVVVALVALARAGVRRLASPQSAGPGLALFGLGLAEIFGSGTSANGILLPAAALLGCVAAEVGDRDGHSQVGTALGPRMPRWALFSAALAALALVSGLSLSAVGRGERDDFEAVRDAAILGVGVEGAAAGAVARHPASYLPVAVLGEWLSDAGRHEEAARWLDRARLLAPYDPDVARLRVVAHLRAGEAPAAQALVKGLAARGTRSLSEVLHSLWRRAPVAEDVVGLAPVPDPGGAATLEIADFLAGERPDLAEIVLVRALAAVPGADTFGVRLGSLRVDRGDVAGADRLALDFLVQRPRSPTGWMIAGQAAAARGQAVEARHLFLEAAAMAPSDPEPVFRAALALVDTGVPASDVESDLTRLNALARGADLRWRVAVLRSRMAEREGLYLSAADWLLEAERLRPRQHEILTRLASLYGRAGDTQGAIIVLRRILATYPWDVRARQDLASLVPGG